MKCIKKMYFGIVLIGMISTASVQATECYWDGSDSTSFTTSGNWVGGTVPINNDYSDRANFDDDNLAGAKNKTCNIPSNRSINKINFEDSGYSLTGAQIVTKYFTSYATSGTNIVYNIKTAQKDNTYGVTSGGTVVVGSFYQDGNSFRLTLKNGGTFVLNNKIGSYNSGTPNLYLQDICVVVKQSTVYNYSDGYVTLARDGSGEDGTSELQLKTSVSSAQSLISSNKIRKIDTFGKDLVVTDIGGGYVSIKYETDPEGSVFVIE